MKMVMKWWSILLKMRVAYVPSHSFWPFPVPCPLYDLFEPIFKIKFGWNDTFCFDSFYLFVFLFLVSVFLFLNFLFPCFSFCSLLSVWCPLFSCPFSSSFLCWMSFHVLISIGNHSTSRHNTQNYFHPNPTHRNQWELRQWSAYKTKSATSIYSLYPFESREWRESTGIQRGWRRRSISETVVSPFLFL